MSAKISRAGVYWRNAVELAAMVGEGTVAKKVFVALTCDDDIFN